MKNIKFLLVFLFGTSIFLNVDGKDVYHVYPSDQKKPGSFTLSQAFSKINTSDEEAEVIVHSGHYRGTYTLIDPKMKTNPKKCKIRSEGEVVFDGGEELQKVEAIDKAIGVYKAEMNWNIYPLTSIWERGSRVRYTRVPDLNSVKVTPGSFCLAGKNAIYFHTSDHKSYEDHHIEIGRYKVGISISRKNVEIEGLEFRNYIINRWSSSLSLNSIDSIIRDCKISNCYRGLMGSMNAKNVLIEKCVIVDCGTGIYTEGKDFKVLKSRITKKRDLFLLDTHDQDDSGILYYHPAYRGIIRFNFVKGFFNGIFMKAHTSQYIIEHNTIVDSILCGLYNLNWNHESVYRQNIISNTVAPLLKPVKYVMGFGFDENIFYRPKQLDDYYDSLTTSYLFGAGYNNIIADPGFYREEANDYRVKKGSLADKLGDAEGPVGAFPTVKNENEVVENALLKVRVLHPAIPLADQGERFFEKDPWLGGDTNFIKKISEKNKYSYITGSYQLKLQIENITRGYKPELIHYKINGGKVYSKTFYPYLKIQLLKDVRSQKIELWMSNKDEKVSKTSVLMIDYISKPPELLSFQTKSSRMGVNVFCETRTPTFLSLHYSVEGKQWKKVKTSPIVERVWNIETGGDDVENWYRPKKKHVFSIGSPHLGPGDKMVYLKVELENRVGQKTIVEQGKVELKGDPRTFYLDPKGNDQWSGGGKEKGFKTLQFALDQLLPGDTLILNPGIYKSPGALYRGGTEKAPITIKALKARTVVLEGDKKGAVQLRIDKAPHVKIENLEIRWFRRYGLYVYQSPHIEIRNCYIWNNFIGENSWPAGFAFFIDESPFSLLEHNTAFRSEHGFYLMLSPNAIVRNNTSTSNLFDGLVLLHSCENSKVYNNAFCYTGNEAIVIHEKDDSVFKDLYLDYNNYATKLRALALKKKGAIELKPKFSYMRQSKAVFKILRKRYYSLDSWQRAYGKDRNSIYKDPDWVDPKVQNWSLNRTSPNINAGIDGMLIGAKVP